MQGFPQTSFPSRIEYHQFKQNQKPVRMPKFNKPQQREQGVTLTQQMRQVFEGSFICLLLGRPGSGKTSMLTQLLNRQEFYGKKFGRILYITPSDIPGISHDQKINTCRTLDIEWINRKVKQYQDKCKNILLVIDDVIADIPPNQRCGLKTIFYDRRHILGPRSCLSIIVTSQKYTCVPKWLRTCLDMFFCFCVQPSQIKIIAAQLNTLIQKTRKTLIPLFQFTKRKNFQSLIYIDMNGTTLYYAGRQDTSYHWPLGIAIVIAVLSLLVALRQLWIIELSYFDEKEFKKNKQFKQLYKNQSPITKVP